MKESTAKQSAFFDKAKAFNNMIKVNVGPAQANVFLDVIDEVIVTFMEKNQEAVDNTKTVKKESASMTQKMDDLARDMKKNSDSLLQKMDDLARDMKKDSASMIQKMDDLAKNVKQDVREIKEDVREIKKDSRYVITKVDDVSKEMTDFRLESKGEVANLRIDLKETVGNHKDSMIYWMLGIGLAYTSLTVGLIYFIGTNSPK